jgi:hypothetical protein
VLAGWLLPRLFCLSGLVFMRKQFYEKVLPSQGVYCVTEISKDKKVVNRFASSLDEVEALVEEINVAGKNVFIALSSFSGHSRMSDYAAYCRSFFVDLDVKPDKPGCYKSKAEAVEDLDHFLKVTELPPPIVVDSGNGIHAYWPFEEDVPIAEWKAYADKFKQLCLDHMKIDPVVTADVTRIMRCPETFNFKTDPPNPTSFLTDEFNQYDFGAFKDYLGEVDTPVGSILDLIPKGLDEDTRQIAKLDNFETTFQEIAELSLNGSGCNQIKNALVNSETLAEPIWHSALSIARHCTDWDTAIYLMSEDYPGYSPEATLRKANETLGKPHSCSIFEQRNPGGCNGCPHKGKITNPLALGRKFVAAPTAEAISQEDTVRVAENPEEIPVFPKAVLPYVRGRTGGIYYLPPAEIDEDGVSIQPEPVLISTNEFFPVQRMYGEEEGELFLLRVVLPHEIREKYISMGEAQSVESMKVILGKAGVAPPNQKLWPKIVEYTMKWAHYLQSRDRAENVCRQMGWSQDLKSFIIGETEYYGNGQQRRAASSPLIRDVSRLMKPKGDFQVWKDCINKLNQPELEMQAFGVFISFGSPLMRFTSTNGMSFCFTGLSGAAKSGSLLAALSVWGSPKPLSVYESTDNAFNSRAMSLKNIMMGMDEVHDKPPEQISKLVHLISQGKGKMRMQSSVNAEREQQQIASMLCLMSSNISLYDLILSKKANASGEIMRLLEYVLVQPSYLTIEVGRSIFDPLHDNYGHAGAAYIDRLLTLGEQEIKARIAKWSKRLVASKLGSNAAFRFYETAFSATFAGAEIAVEAGIINLDIERIYDKVILETIKVRDNTQKHQVTDYEGLITEFLNDQWRRGTLIFDEGRVINEPHGELVARVEIGSGTQYVSKSKFKKFLAEKSVGSAEFEKALEKSTVKLESKKMRLSTGWKAGMNSPPIHVYAFQYDIPKEMLDDSNQSH